MSELTHVELVWVKNRIENRIRFGRIAEQHIIDRQRRVVSFMAGRTFPFLPWTANQYRPPPVPLDIPRAAAPRARPPAGPPVRPPRGRLPRTSRSPKRHKGPP